MVWVALMVWNLVRRKSVKYGPGRGKAHWHTHFLFTSREGLGMRLRNWRGLDLVFNYFRFSEKPKRKFDGNFLNFPY